MTESIGSWVDMFKPFGEVVVRKMFGGFGVYYQGLMIGLVADGQLYLKVDDESTQLFEQAGSSPFTYTRMGKPVVMSFYSAPAFDGDAPVLYWASLAYEAALRAQSRRNRRRRTSRPRSQRLAPFR